MKCAQEATGKRRGSAGKKIGNVPLRWAFAEAAVLVLRPNQPGKEYLAPRDRKPGKAQALPVLAPKLARAVDSRLTRAQAVDRTRFGTASPAEGRAGARRLTGR